MRMFLDLLELLASYVSHNIYTWYTEKSMFTEEKKFSPSRLTYPKQKKITWIGKTSSECDEKFVKSIIRWCWKLTYMLSCLEFSHFISCSSFFSHCIHKKTWTEFKNVHIRGFNVMCYDLCITIWNFYQAIVSPHKSA